LEPFGVDQFNKEDKIQGFEFDIITVTMVIFTILFLYGTPFYRQKLPRGNLVTGMVQFVVVAIRKKKYRHASIHELDLQE
jgi:hypothetical protein